MALLLAPVTSAGACASFDARPAVDPGGSDGGRDAAPAGDSGDSDGGENIQPDGGEDQCGVDRVFCESFDDDAVTARGWVEPVGDVDVAGGTLNIAPPASGLLWLERPLASGDSPLRVSAAVTITLTKTPPVSGSADVIAFHPDGDPDHGVFVAIVDRKWYFGRNIASEPIEDQLAYPFDAPTGTPLRMMVSIDFVGRRATLEVDKEPIGEVEIPPSLTAASSRLMLGVSWRDQDAPWSMSFDDVLVAPRF